MKVVYCLLISLFSHFIISQNNAITVSGTVKSSGGNEPVENAIIYLKSSSGVMLESKTDVSGNYHFEIKNDTSSNIELSCHTEKLTKSGNPSPCGWLANADIGKATLKSNTNIIKDFTLTRITGCGTVPYIMFGKDSDKSCNDMLHKTDSAKYELYENTISFYVGMLQANPGIVVEISGHASSNEKSPEQLSLQRAKNVKKALVAKGINPKRLLTEGYGSKRLLVKDDMILSTEKTYTVEEKEALHAKNRRAIIKIVNWDFEE